MKYQKLDGRNKISVESVCPWLRLCRTWS